MKKICCALLPATKSLKMPNMKKTCCVLLPLSLMMSFKMKICCVLLLASLWRRYSYVLLVSSAVYFNYYFYQCVYQIECLRCQVPSREGLYEWDMLAINIYLKKTKTTTTTTTTTTMEGSLIQLHFFFFPIILLCPTLTYFPARGLAPGGLHLNIKPQSTA